MLTNIKYRNALPPGFESWTELFLHCDLAGIVGHVTRHKAREKILFEPKTFNCPNPNNIGKLELDVDFLKARLFDEFVLHSQVNTEAFRKTRAVAFTHPDQSAFAQDHFKAALYELSLLTRTVSRIQGNQPLKIPNVSRHCYRFPNLACIGKQRSSISRFLEILYEILAQGTLTRQVAECIAWNKVQISRFQLHSFLGIRNFSFSIVDIINTVIGADDIFVVPVLVQVHMIYVQ